MDRCSSSTTMTKWHERHGNPPSMGGNTEPRQPATPPATPQPREGDARDDAHEAPLPMHTRGVCRTGHFATFNDPHTSQMGVATVVVPRRPRADLRTTSMKRTVQPTQMRRCSGASVSCSSVRPTPDDPPTDVEMQPSSPCVTKTLFMDDSNSDDDDDASECSARQRMKDNDENRLQTPPMRRRSTGGGGDLKGPSCSTDLILRTPPRRRSFSGRRSLTDDDDATSTTRELFGSPLPVERRSPVLRHKVPFPGLYSPVLPPKSAARRPLNTDGTFGGLRDVSMSMCSTASAWSAWDSPPSGPTPVVPLMHNSSFKSPAPPPTPLKHQSITPSRHQFLNRREMLVQVHYECNDEPKTESYDDLETIGRLGAGVSSEVSKVYSSRTGKYYALKRSKHELRSQRERDMMLHEISTVHRLAATGADFKHIIKYHQAWQLDGYFYVQTELCEGGTLRDFVQHHGAMPLPEDCMWTILRHVAKGLSALHCNQIVHLDIKPENIFITIEGQLKIGDFGVAAHACTPSYQMEDLEGDAVYMAPELLASGERHPSADVFCLGIMLLELATRIELPASGDLWQALRQGHLPPLPTTYSNELRAAIAQMMHPDPTSRPSAAAILAHPFIKTNNGASQLILDYARHHDEQYRQLNASCTSLTETPQKQRLSFSLYT